MLYFYLFLLLFCVFYSSHRSTKLVIIERLLLLAERYVITIEVGPEFSSDFLNCMVLVTLHLYIIHLYIYIIA